MHPQRERASATTTASPSALRRTSPATTTRSCIPRNASSAYRPVMYVNYVSHAGIEGWWQYEQMSAGRAGTAYADLFNGNLVLEHSDTVMTATAIRCPLATTTTAAAAGQQLWQRLRLEDRRAPEDHGADAERHELLRLGGRRRHRALLRVHRRKRPLQGRRGHGAGAADRHFGDAGSRSRTSPTTLMTFKILQAGLAWLESTKDACGNTSTYTYVSGHETEGRLDKIHRPGWAA